LIDQNKFGNYFELTLSIFLKYENEEDGEVEHEANVDGDVVEVEDHKSEEDDEEQQDIEKEVSMFF
jgi:hypothetical protein